MKYSFLSSFCFRTIIAAIVICAAISQTRAEYVFKKDGAIIEGKIIVDGGTSVTIMTPDKKRQTIQRKDIMRVLYTKLYMGKVFIRMTTGETQEGYVVDEDQDNYFVRKDITKPEEITIQRIKVMFIARSNPTDLVGTAAQHEITLKWSAPYIPGKKYRVYIKGPKETEFAKPIEISGTSYTISKLKSNSAFRVYITSVDGTGVESLPSEHIEVTTLNIPPTAPGEIQKETVENFDPAKAGLSMKWAPSTDADGEIVEYRVYKDTTEGTELKLGSTKKPEFFISNANLTNAEAIRVTAVDSMGTESDGTQCFLGSTLSDKGIFIRLRPVFAYPLGDMGKLYGVGFGTGVGLFANSYFIKNCQIGIEAGFIRWAGEDKNIKSMNMVPIQGSLGYRFFASDQLSFTPSLGAGIAYMSTSYTDAAFQSATKTGIEPIISLSLSAEYTLSSKLYLFGGIDYSTIYEKSGRKNFAGAHLGAGIKL